VLCYLAINGEVVPAGRLLFEWRSMERTEAKEQAFWLLVLGGSLTRVLQKGIIARHGGIYL
jgi:Tfp pilus assembly protein PilN